MITDSKRVKKYRKLRWFAVIPFLFAGYIDFILEICISK